MAESSGEKTEMPTQKKLRDARQKGQVCTSKDIVSTAILVVLFALLGWMGVALVDDGTMLLSYVGQRLEGDPFAATRPAMGMANLPRQYPLSRYTTFGLMDAAASRCLWMILFLRLQTRRAEGPEMTVI